MNSLLTTKAKRRRLLGGRPSRRRRTAESSSRYILTVLLAWLFVSQHTHAFLIHSSAARTSTHRLCAAYTNGEHRALQRSTIPQHVAFVCDGNSRWARARHLPAAAGHAAGADRLVKVLDGLTAAGVSYATMYGFSTENWKRPASEINDILRVVEETARKFYNRAIQECVRVRILGDLTDERLPRSLVEVLQRLERDTAMAEGVTLCLAINYGGRRDIVNAAKCLAARLVDGSLDGDCTEETFASLLSTAGIPDPDIMIRTSGESRLSNFLLWNLAYTELYFTDVLWPDFDEACLSDALSWYAQRRRRYGARETITEPTVNGHEVL